MWEPHLAGARKCNDCGYEKYSSSGPWVKEPCKHEPIQIMSEDPSGYTVSAVILKCVKCNAELKATWSEK